MRQGFALLISAVLLIATSWAAAEAVPRWASSKQAPDLWANSKVLLKDELSPDDPERTRPIVAMRYKYIARILASDDIALVVVAMRQGREFHPSTTFYKVYSVDLKSKAKSTVAEIGYQWRFLKFANFDGREVPDVVYRFDSCTECESTQLAGSFYLDATARRWKIREWPEVGSEIEIGSAPQHGDDEDYQLDCLYAIADFTGDGREDFATWCRTIGEKKGIRSEAVTLYTVTDKPERRVLQGDSGREVRKKLCARHPRSGWCQ